SMAARSSSGRWRRRAARSSVRPRSSSATSRSTVGARRSGAGLCGEQPAQHVGEGPAVAGGVTLARRVEPEDRAELTVVGAHGHLPRLAVVEPRDGERLAAGQAERLTAVAGEELERQDAHHQEVRAVDALEALCDRGANAEQARAL